MSKKRSASGYKFVRGSSVRVPVSRESLYYETKIARSDGSICYLRGRYDVAHGKVIWSVRTQANGRGKALVKLAPVPMSQIGSALDRLNIMMPFCEVVYDPYISFRKRADWAKVYKNG